MQKCIIYGAGKWGQQAYKEYSDIVEVIAFLDSNTQKSGEFLCGLRIKKPEEMLEYKDALVLIAVSQREGIKDYLYSLGYSDVLEYTPGAKLDLQRYLKGEISFYHIEGNVTERESVESVVNKLKKYDVISFDIFDTSIFRLVENPQDIFRIIGKEKRVNNFRKLRNTAEIETREINKKKKGTREVSLNEIYQRLHEYYDIPKVWENDERKIEEDLTERNEYIFKIYKELKSNGKTIVFTSDMYLPQECITNILHKEGYIYDKLYVSNNYGVNKEEGGLFDNILEDFKGEKIIHVGDNRDKDVIAANKKGIETYYYPRFSRNRKPITEETLDSSFYRAIINCRLFNSPEKYNIYYEHGFRVGGILTVGFCKYINKLVKEKKIEKILFCGRDCRIISDVYNRFYKNCDSDYIRISRRAILEVAGKRHLDDFLGRNLFKYFSIDKKAIETILSETGFSYLTEIFEKNDIEIKAYPNEILNIKERCWAAVQENIEEIIEHYSRNIRAAKKYYQKMIGENKRILIVDVGWSGSCITILRDFLNSHFQEKKLKIYGALMCGSKTENFTSAIEQGIISSYIYSPYHNHDMENFMMPLNQSVIESDKIHMPLEYLFTSTEKSLFSYDLEGNNVIFKDVENPPINTEEIIEMQKGIMDFSEVFKTKVDKYIDSISPYTAFLPLMETIKHVKYCKDVYKNFIYDVETTPMGNKIVLFGDIFQTPKKVLETKMNDEGFDCLSERDAQVIVSLTSYPKRMDKIHLCIESLLRQSYANMKIELWLSNEQFPNHENDLPSDVLNLESKNDTFNIFWVDEDLKPHKKYIYSMQKHRDLPIITVDDDVIYDKDLVTILMESYKKHPNAVSCTRAHFITHKKDGTLRKYRSWCHVYSRTVGEELYALIPTGIGGVLYPPNILPDRTFDKELIIKQCVSTDDLWLKINGLCNDKKVVLACRNSLFDVIPGTQEYGLSIENLGNDANDEALTQILNGLTLQERMGVLEKLNTEEGIYAK